MQLAKTADEALEILGDPVLDVALMDEILMPGSDGLAMRRAIKDLRIRPAI